MERVAGHTDKVQRKTSKLAARVLGGGLTLVSFEGQQGRSEFYLGLLGQWIRAMVGMPSKACEGCTYVGLCHSILKTLHGFQLGSQLLTQLA